MEKRLRDAFIAIGGKPLRSAPVYCTLGPNKGLQTWYNSPDCIQIPIEKFDPDTVSFTYGDLFPVFNPALNTGEEWWGKVYRYADIVRLIEQYGLPEDPEYNMKQRLFPEGKSIGQYLKYIEAHVWSDEVLEGYR